jgi:hypothetical protein
MRTVLRKYTEGKLVIEHVVALSSVALFIKATSRNSTTPGFIGKVHWTTCQFVWYLGTQIVSGNLNGHNR